MKAREEYALILDYLPYGYPMEKKRLPIAQAIGVNSFVLLEVVPRKGVTLEPRERVYIGPEKRDKIYFIAGRLKREKLTETAKLVLQEFISNAVSEREKEFVEFFNRASAINTRLHQLELLPGFGKKNFRDVLQAREEKPFESFDDIKQRVKGIPDPRKAVERRIYEELTERQRFNLFVR
ncbi:DUF655 domain-containing protein [Candidatus Pacearchaeota archaeon]|nr:MAG: DUF655 domain-containing protein [Candidatus Pacearchaeota archaeon]